MRKILMIIIMSAGFTFLTHCAGEGSESEHLEESNLEESNLEESNLEESNLEESNLEESNLEEPNLEEPNLGKSLNEFLSSEMLSSPSSSESSVKSNGPDRVVHVRCSKANTVRNYTLKEGSYNARLKNNYLCTLDVYNTYSADDKVTSDWYAVNNLNFCAEVLKDVMEKKVASGWVCQ